MAEVLRRVVGLLERAQHQRAERVATPAAAAHVLLHARRDRADQLRRLRRGHAARRAAGSAPRAMRAGRQAFDALRLGALVHAIQARHAALGEQRCDRLVGGDHQVLDQAVGLGLRARADAALTLPCSSKENSGSSESTISAPLCSRLRCSAAATSRAALERRSPRLGRALGAGEDAIHPLVVQARIGADQRAVEGRPLDARAV